MRLKPALALTLALTLALPATGAHAQETTAKPRLFAALFMPKDRPGKAHGKTELSAERENLKAAVAVAIANKPKGRIWCVPFARAVTGVDIRGNARTWWKQAAGRYDRGQEPRVGAVMNFAASRAMPMGHVAVVSHVVSSREILVDQANWERNRITQDTRVVDVSENNDWSRVRVANGAGTLGRTNPVYGFIYN